jgi:cell division GTPase FtsZ
MPKQDMEYSVMADDQSSFADAALDRIHAVIRACTSGLTGEKLVCLDTADVMAALEPERNVPTQSYVGIGEASGSDRARKAAEAALADLRLHIMELTAEEQDAVIDKPRRARA